MPWTTDIGQRIRGECESIVRAAALIEPDTMNELVQHRAVLDCLLQSMARGRQ